LRKSSKRSFNEVNEVVDSQGSWAISYGDMITLLLSFFVLYFTVDYDAQRDKQLRGSLLLSLDELKVYDSSQRYARMPSSHPALPPEATKDLSELSAVYREIGDSVVVEFDKISSFKLGDTEPNIETIKLLEKFAKVYTPYAGKYLLSVGAFTDSKKVVWGRGRYKDNLELSALRAISTLRILQKNGIPLDRMNVGGFGENRKVIQELKNIKVAEGALDPNDGEAMARKVVLVITPEFTKEEGR